VVDFISSKDDPNDTSAGHRTDRELRKAQVEMRLAELEEAYTAMATICAGQGESSGRNEGAIGSCFQGLESIDWTSWKNRIHLTEVIMVGHSFGAATTVEIARHQYHFQWVSQAIMDDVWEMAISLSELGSKHRIRVPLLGINSKAFMYWPDNFNVAKAICEEVRQHGSLCWLMTVRCDCSHLKV
jgi:platelet-activating factor acetylhydrolase